MFGARAVLRTGAGSAAVVVLAALVALGACSPASDGARFRGDAGVSDLTGHYAVLECVPFARALSGIELRGNAADWWQRAEGRYARTNTPAVGGVLVLRRSARLAHGHVGVVSHVISEREILVTQANWVRNRVFSDMPVIDVSPDNDWRSVRVWWPPAQQMGAASYPAYGFILPDDAVSREQLVANMPSALRGVIGAR